MRTVTIEVSDADYTAIEDWVRRTAEGAPVSKGNPLIAVQNVRFAAAEPAERGEPAAPLRDPNKLLPCPFAHHGLEEGSVLLTRKGHLNYGDGPLGYWVECQGCHALGPPDFTASGARRRWNDRLQAVVEVAIGGTRPAQPPASGEPPEPADWREAVEGALDSENPPPGWVTNTAVVTDAVLTALAPLVLAERLRAERLRRALETLRRGCPTAEEQAELRYGPEWRERVIEQTLASDPPSAALAELLGLPDRFAKRARKAQGEAERHPDRVRRHYCDGKRQAHDEDARAVAAVLAKLGLPAGEEAGDG